MMKKRRPVGKKIYSVIYLLDKQPKSLKKEKHYQLMVSFLQNSPTLTGVRFNRRCYSLLNDAIIKPEHLENFYKTYRLPVNPFFPLFFMVKRKYLLKRDNKKLERLQYIETKMEELPSYIRRYSALMKELELKYNRANQFPAFKENLVPKTKKKADLFAKYNHAEWIFFFGNYMSFLADLYVRIPSDLMERMSACLILNCLPSSFSEVPQRSKVSNRYRSFSKIYHPDAGGDQELFIKIKWARDLLIEKTER